jgi:outer membrane protein TolC
MCSALRLRHLPLLEALLAFSLLTPASGASQEAGRAGMPCVNTDVPKTVEFRDAVVTALDQEPQLAIARQEVAKARANLTAALTPFLPAVVGTFMDEKFVPSNGIAPITVVGNQIIGGTQTFSSYGSLGLTWNVFSGGKDIAGRRGARASSRSSRAALESQLNDTLTGLFQAYGDLFDAQRSVLEQRRTSALLREMQARAEERFTHGDGTSIAVDQARNKASDSERSLFQACHTVATKSAALAKAAGMRLTVGFLLGVSESLPPLDVERAGVIPADQDSWLEHDPAVIAAMENVTVAETKLRQAKAAFGPTISIVGRRDFLGQNPDGLGAANRDIGPNSYRIGVQVQQAILPFTSESAAVSGARADFREAELKYAQATTDAQGRVQESWAMQRETLAALQEARASLESSQRVLTLTESLYRAGRTDVDNLQNAQIDLEKSRSLLERTASDLLVADWLFYRAVHPKEFMAALAERLSVELQLSD